MILLALIAALSAGTTTSSNDETAVSRHVESVQSQTVAAPFGRNYTTGGNDFVLHQASDSSYAKTRAQVMHELRQAKADGSYDLMHQEFDGQYRQAAASSNENATATSLASADGTISQR